MKLLARLAAIAVTAAALAAGAAIGDAGAAGFKRGATMVEFFNFAATTGEGPARTYANPPFPNARPALARINFEDVRRLGFDHMRVPMDLGPMMWGTERQRRDILDQLGAVIAELHRHDLAVLVALYPPSLQRELPETYLDGLRGPKCSRYFEMVERLARELSTIRSGLVALEPMNEPQSECRSKTELDWTEYQQFMVARIRSIAPELPLFLTGGCWSNIEGIVLLDSDLLRDRRNFVSVHFYYPFLFTHQSATWTMPYLAGSIGVPYPASAGSVGSALTKTRERFRSVPLAADVDRTAALHKAEREIVKYFVENQGRTAVQSWMKRVADWQERQGVQSDQIVFTEFGAMKQVQGGIEIDKASRARWLQDVSSEIEGRGWGWTVYVLQDDPFGLYARKGDPYPEPGLLRALRLKEPRDDRALR